MALQTAIMAGLPSETAHFGGTRGKRRSSAVLTGLLLVTIGFIYYYNDSLWESTREDADHFRFKSHQGRSKTKNLSLKPGMSSSNIFQPHAKSSQTSYYSTIKQYPACPIPQLEPYHESIRQLVDNLEIPSSFNCKGNYPILFKSTLQSRIIPAKGRHYLRRHGYESCCYRTVRREELQESPTTSHEILSTQCFPVNRTTETKIPDGHEFIAIFCQRKGQKESLVDVHSFAHLKPSSSNEGTEEEFNVVIFGLDGMSRMNFLRTMPQSYSFLKTELEAVEMFGYNKVAENTPQNIMPMLMSGMPDRCFEGWSVDNCPFIWKEYAKQGYSTMFSEDGSISLFNDMGMGFMRQPTDYYLRPFSGFADDKFKTYTCYGPRLTFQVLLDYMEKFVHTMSRHKKNFFEFTWATALSHDYINAPLLGDSHLLKSLRRMKKAGHLNNTIFILMSDHGNRMDKIRSTVQGQLEDRLPLLYFVLPESFKRNYTLAYRNLLYNADKLVTTYDLHETLKDILNLDMIRGRKLLEREDDLYRVPGRNLTGGISLFLPIPEYRTCEMAGIRTIFCSCSYMEVASVPDWDSDVGVVAKLAVSHINSIFGSSSTTNCSILHLHTVSMVRLAGFSADTWQGYIINFETKPGGGQFEALVAKDIDGVPWKVQDPILRTNRYGNQSHCVQNIINLKPYCYCLE